MQPFYSLSGEFRIRNWINNGVVENFEDTVKDSEWMDELISQQ